MKKIYTYIESPLGKILLMSNGVELTGCYFVGQKYPPQLDPTWQEVDAKTETFQHASQQLSEYFQGTRKQFDLGLLFDKGTNFQQKVWQAIAAIPFGETRSYQQLAQSINLPKSARAVGMATGRNPISLIVPCHRVIGSNGSLTGYAGGLERKKSLLTLENAA